MLQLNRSTWTGQLASFLLLLLIVSSVLLVLPFTQGLIFHAKLYSLFAVTFLTIFVYGLGLLTQKKFQFISSPFSGPLFLFGLMAVISSFLSAPYPVKNLLDAGGVIIAGVLLVMFLPPLLPKKLPVKMTLAVTLTLLALASLLQTFGFGPALLLNQLFKLQLPNSALFNLAGSSLIALQIFLIGTAYFVGKVRVSKHVDKLTLAVVPILLIGIGLQVWSMLPGKPAAQQLPPFSATWSVMLDSVRSPRSAMIGVGPGQYGSAFAQYRPGWMNGREDWNVIYSQASNIPLYVLTTMGFLGLIAWVLIALQILKQARQATEEGRPLAWALMASLIMQLVLPFNVAILALQFALLAAFIAVEKRRFSVVEFQAMAVEVVRQVGGDPFSNRRSNSSAGAYFLGGFFILLALVGGYFVGRSYYAFILDRRAVQAGLDNRAIDLYNLRQEAVRINPYQDTFRRSYALTNLSLAVALSNQAEPTAEDQQQVTELVQQAVREARVATTLDPSDWQNWYTLSQIYQNLIGSSEDALQWAIQSYVETINRSPSDPNLRIQLGGIFLGDKQLQQAISLFQGAVNLKPDFANAYYNLAISLKQANQLESSRNAYQSLLNLLDPNSEDFSATTKELEELEKEIEKTTPAQSATGSAKANQSLIEQNLNTPDNQGVSNVNADVDLNPPAQTNGVSPTPAAPNLAP